MRPVTDIQVEGAYWKIIGDKGETGDVYPEAVGVTTEAIESFFSLLIKFGRNNALVRERLARRLRLFKDLRFLSTWSNIWEVERKLRDSKLWTNDGELGGGIQLQITNIRTRLCRWRRVKKKPEQGIFGKELFKLCGPYGEESVVEVSQGSAFLNPTGFKTHVSRHRGWDIKLGVRCPSNEGFLVFVRFLNVDLLKGIADIRGFRTSCESFATSNAVQAALLLLLEWERLFLNCKVVSVQDDETPGWLRIGRHARWEPKSWIYEYGSLETGCE